MDAVTAVVAHRGSSADAPEHTLSAYQQAVDDGADALECDVRLTADGHLVCVHDRRIDRTSDGRGVVSVMTLRDLDRLDFGRWRGDTEHPELGSDPVVVDEARSRVLTLERLLELVVDSERELGLAIETKHPTRYAGLVEERTVELLQRFGLARPRSEHDSRIRVMSFSQLSMRRVRALAPGLPTVFLMDRVPLRFRDGSLPFGARITGPSIEIVRAHPRYVARAHRAGAQVHVWTVDEPADVALCLDLGVDAIITNRPGMVLAQIASSASGSPADAARGTGADAGPLAAHG
jgi:glycerophosphoryl diester phosphodiesterase